MKKGILFGTFVLILTLAFLMSVQAASIGVSPATVYFDNMYIKTGYAENYVTISVSTPYEIPATAEVRGEVADWLRFEREFTVSQASPYRLKLIASPPYNVEPGTYKGFLRITTGELGQVTGGAGTTVIASVDSEIIIETTEKAIISCRVNNIEVESIEQGNPIPFSASVRNTGNKRIKPKLIINIWDVDQTELVKSAEFVGEEILPTTQGDVIVEVQNDLELGQYWADVTVEQCGVSKLLTFDIVKPGTLTANGVLKRVVSKVWVNVGETIPITAIFENTGKNPVSAKFKGVVTLAGRVVKLLETEELLVPANKEINFTTYFEPEEQGRHIAKGRVYYSNKRTYESFTVINVLSKFNLKLIIYLLIAAAIIFLLYLIVKGKQRRPKEIGPREF